MKPNNILLSALLASALTANAQVKINVDVANPGVKVSPNLYGIFFEDINHAADGGLYAELISNRSFEDSDNATPTWRTKAADGATISTQLVSKALLNNAQGKALQISVAARKNATASLVNEGFWGINAVQGRTYKLSLWAKGNYKGGVKARLISADGKSVYAETAVDAKMGKKWSKFTASLTANANDPKAQFELVFQVYSFASVSSFCCYRVKQIVVGWYGVFPRVNKLVTDNIADVLFPIDRRLTSYIELNLGHKLLNLLLGEFNSHFGNESYLEEITIWLRFPYNIHSLIYINNRFNTGKCLDAEFFQLLHSLDALGCVVSAIAFH